MLELHPWQEDALAELKNGSVLVGGVGSGKSITGLSYFTRLDPTKKIVVITTAKKRDSGEWFSDAMKMGLRNEMVVDSWNNLKNYVDKEDCFFLFDEQKVIGWGAWTKAFLQITKQNDWIIMSATPADTWMDLCAIFVAHGFFDNKTQFTNEHVKWSRFHKFPKVDGYYDEWILERYRDQIYVIMPYQAKADRVDHIINVDFDLDEQRRLWVDRWNFYDDVPLKDAGELMRYLRVSANSHRSRYDEIVKLSAKHPKMIIFYNHDYELDILRCLHSELDIPLAEWNGHFHQDIPFGDRWIYLVQYQAGSEAWNCTLTDTIVFYSLPYSYKQLEQAKGRIDRLNTNFEVLNYYLFKSQAIIDKAIWKALSRKKNFQASAFAKKAWPGLVAARRLN